jgi:ribosomal-protein-alanine N-acetyltransferase
MCGDPMRKFSGKAGSRVGVDGIQGCGGVNVRKFRAGDVEAVVGISMESKEASNWSNESYIKLVAEEGVSALVIETDGEISGFLVGRRAADQAEILNVAVRVDHRRKGQGAALLSAALEEFGLGGAKSVYLEVRESNTGAIAFYEKHGFDTSGRRKGYYQEPDEAAVTMEKKIHRLDGLEPNS